MSEIKSGMDCACVHFDRYVCANERYGRTRNPDEWDACDCCCHDDYDDERDEEDTA